nr:hypothetical protein [Bacteroidota bacterium]
MLKNIIIFALFANFAKAQNLNRFWIFGDSCGIDFANPNFPLPIQSGMDGQGSCSNIADNNGKLKLYTWNQSGIDDSVSTIYNRNDTVVKNGTRLCGGDLYNQNVIIPLNKFDTAYYIFHQGILTTDGLYFTKIIFNSTDSLGIVTSKNNNILQHRLGDCLTAVKHGNGRDWWIITKYSDFNSPNFYNRFFAFQQVQDSLFFPLIQDFNDATDVDFQKIIWHPSYNKFMLINLRGYIAEFNFDRCTGLITKTNYFHLSLFLVQTHIIFFGTVPIQKMAIFLCFYYSLL